MPSTLNDIATTEARLRSALLQNPDNAQAWLELGDLLAGARRFVEAEAAYKACIAASPSSAPAYLQLAKLCLTANRTAEATDYLKLADASCQSNHSQTRIHVEVLELMARLLLRDGKLMEALPYLQAAAERGADHATRALFANCLARVKFTGPRPDLKPILAQLLSDAVIPPADLVRPAISLLLCEPNLHEMLDAKSFLGPPAQRFANDILLLSLLTSAIVVDAALEIILTAMRRSLLLAVSKNSQPAGHGNEWLAFTAALACQCFVNDYAFVWNDTEEQGVERLCGQIESALGAGAAPSAVQIAVLACYRPLISFPFHAALLELSWPKPLEQTMTLQVRACLQDLERAQSIPALTATDGKITDPVRRHYEETPYPRWLKVPPQPAAAQFQNLARSTLPPHMAERESLAEPANILVAGCGTGQESTTIALQFPYADILAVDLSVTSLAYAARRSEEYGARNIRYVQADLLHLGEFGPFDLTVSAGVLHHLNDPVEGLKVLTGVTRPGGYLMLALYSALGRQGLDPVSAFARARGYQTTPEGLRQFRFDILNLEASDPVRVNALAWDDFYSLNMLRDLLFHPCEHRMTISDIAAALAALGLEFRGFLVPPEVRQRFLSRFGGAGDLLSLTHWDQLEKENPAIFSSMYHFMVRKPEA